MTNFYALIFTILICGAAAKAQQAQELLNRALDRYSNATRFNCAVSIYSRHSSEMPVVSGQINFKRNDYVEISWITDPCKQYSSGTKFSVSGSGTKFLLTSNREELGSYNSLSAAVVGATGVSLGLAYTLPSILLGGFGNMDLRKMDDLLLLPTKDVHGERCYVLQGISIGQKCTLWLRAKDLAIVQFVNPAGYLECYQNIRIETKP